jgi:hypothetical protein
MSSRTLWAAAMTVVLVVVALIVYNKWVAGKI